MELFATIRERRRGIKEAKWWWITETEVLKRIPTGCIIQYPHLGRVSGAAVIARLYDNTVACNTFYVG